MSSSDDPRLSPRLAPREGARADLARDALRPRAVLLRDALIAADAVGGGVGEVVTADVLLRGGRVAALLADGAGRDEVRSPDAARDDRPIELDARGCTVAPGFVDLQVNGFGGVDVASAPHRVGEIARSLLAHGVTAFLPTVITSTAEVRAATLAQVSTFAQVSTRADVSAPIGARVLGVHLEGPCLAASRAGAHPRQLLRAPDAVDTDAWDRAHHVALVTLAPELDGAGAVVRTLMARGVAVFAGHTEADADTMRAAVALGVRGLTHAFNAMAPLGHRAPGAIGVALVDERVACCVIADGVHVDPSVVDIVYRCAGPSRTLLVSDAVAAAGTPPGAHRFADREVRHDGHAVRLADGTLAGSMLTLDRAVRHLADWTRCHLATAARCASTVPAAAIGRSDVGVLRVGCVADVVVLDQHGEVMLTCLGGVAAHDPQRLLT